MDAGVVVGLDEHPLLEAGLFETAFPRPLGELASPAWLLALLAPGASAPLSSDDTVRSEVRRLLRSGGYKPTGRGKPSSEYLLRAVAEGALAGINLAVDACNAVSLHSGLPISVVDLDRVVPPLRIGLAPEGARYAFNASGQEIELAGLLCLHDAGGPCANGVKDSQRSKTHAGTRRTLTVIWGSRALPGRTAATLELHTGLLGRAGAHTLAARVAEA